MHIGLYFGSFNPVHIGHLIIANYCSQHTGIDQVWMVLTPSNPHKDARGLLNEYHRLHLVQVAIENEDRIKASDIEFHLPRPSYTASTMVYLQEKYPHHQFSIIMGSDSFSNLHKWHRFQFLIDHYQFIVYRRPGFDVSDNLGAKITILDAPLLEISSTAIRTMIKNGQNIRYLVHDNTLEEISRNSYYK